MITIVLVDDHQLMRAGIKQFLAYVDDCNVIGEASTGDEAIESIRNLKPNLVLLDLNIPGPRGAVLIQKIVSDFAETKVLVLTMHNEATIARQAIKAGAKGYVKKDSAPEELLTAIRVVASGGIFISQDIMERIVFDDADEKVPYARIPLSGQEIKVLKLIAQGERGKSIAIQLGLSEKTVSAHKVNIKNKIQAKTDVELVDYAKSIFLTA